MKIIRAVIRWHQSQWNQIKAEPVITLGIWFLFGVALVCLPSGEPGPGDPASFLAATFGLISVVFFMQIFRRSDHPSRWQNGWELSADIVFGMVFFLLYLRIRFEGILPGPWPVYFVILPIVGSLSHAALTGRSEKREATAAVGSNTA